MDNIDRTRSFSVRVFYERLENNLQCDFRNEFEISCSRFLLRIFHGFEAIFSLY
jgi:hypothetical protein